MAKIPGADKWTSAVAKDGVGNPALKSNNANANPSLQDTDVNTISNKPVMKATSHMEGMTWDGGVDKPEWQGNVKC